MAFLNTSNQLDACLLEFVGMTQKSLAQVVSIRFDEDQKGAFIFNLPSQSWKFVLDYCFPTAIFE
jgi:hypothetical protein